MKTDLRLSRVLISQQSKMNNHPISARNIDISKVTFVPGPAKAGRNPSIALKYNGQNLHLAVPRAGFPGGVMARVDEHSGATSYTMMGTMKNCDPYAKERSTDDSDMSHFYNFLLDLETLVVKEATENSVKWFGKKRSEEAILDGWKRILGVSNNKVDGEYVPNGKYPPSFKVKVPVYDGRVSTEVVDSNLDPVYLTPDSLLSVFPKGIECMMTLSGSIYVMAGGGFGLTWRLQTAQTFAKKKLTAADIYSVEQEETGDSEEVPESQERPSTPVDQPVQLEVPSAPGGGGRKRRPAVSQ